MPESQNLEKSDSPSILVNIDKSSSSSKTPVSLLQELYVRRSLTPKYDLVQIEGAVHEPIFKYRVTLGEYVATGSGSSKKKAKHASAKAMFEHIRMSEQVLDADVRSKISQVLDNNMLGSTSSQFDDGIEGNPVGNLQEVCMNRRLKPPLYELTIDEKGKHASNERCYLVIAIVGQHREIGSGPSKKIAKRLAALKMLQTLRLLPSTKNAIVSEEALDEDDLAQGIALRRDNLITAIFFKNLEQQHLIGPKMTYLMESVDPETDFLKVSVEFLENLALELNFEVTFLEIIERSKDDQNHCLVQLSMDPVAMCYGVGNSSIDAKKDCAFNSLLFLRTLAK